MAEVAVAYMPVVPTMRGLQRNLTAAVTPAAGAAGDSAGRTMGQRMTATLKTGAKVAGGAMVGILGTSLVKGFQRLSAIENAEAKLRGLGNSAEDTSKIMDNALAAVKGTAFGMDEAATTAASAVAAGVKPGQELQKYLGLVGDAATIAGTDMASMGSIFNKVMTSGKVQGDVFAQLSDSGIPVVQMLAESMGVTAAEVYKLGSKGKISSEQFLVAMSSMEGAALKGGETTTGAFKNMMAALSRFGAGILKGIFPLIGPFFNLITKGLDAAESVVTPFVTRLSTAVGTELAGGFRAFGAAWTKFDGDVTSAGFPGFMERAAFRLRTIWEELRGGIIAFGASWRHFNGDVTSSGFPGFMERAAFAIRTVWEALKSLDFSSWSAFKDSLGNGGGQIADAFGRIGTSLVTLRPAFSAFLEALPKIGGAAGTIAVAGLTMVADILGFLARHVDTIIKFMPAIVAGFVAWRVATMGLAISSQRLQLIQARNAPILLASNALRVTAIMLENRQTAATAANTTATATNNAAQNGGVLARTRAVIATVAHRVATVAATIATNAAALAQRALNMAMRMNPIGIVITALAALVAGLVWFFTQTETGRRVWETVWNAIKTTIANVVSWFQTTVVPAFQVALAVLGQVFQWLYSNVIVPVWNGIRTAINVAVTVVKVILGGLYLLVTQVIGPVFVWLYNSVIVPIWNAIKVAISVAVSVIRGYLSILTWYVQTVLGPIFRWLYNNVVLPVWRAIQQAIAWAWSAIQVTFSALKLGLQWLGDKFNWTRDWVSRIWSAMAQTLRNGWNWIDRHVFSPVKTGVDLVKQAFDAAQRGVSKAWDKLKDAVKTPVGFVVNKVVNPFIGGYNELNDFWGGDDLKKIDGFSRGGVLPGYQHAKRDDVLTPMRRGEGVLVPEVVRGLGAKFVHAVNRVGNSGGVQAVKRWASERGYARGGIVRPTSGPVTSGYGPRWGGFHDALDFGAGMGTPVVAAKSGQVIKADWSAYGGGNEVQIKHAGNLHTWYSHLSSIATRVGAMVNAGARIGAVGSTGNSTGPHLHFAVYQGGWPNHRDPAGFLGGSVVGDGSGGSGGGVFGWAVEKLRDFVTGPIKDAEAAHGSNKFLQMPLGIARKAVDAVIDKVASVIGGGSGSSGSGGPSAERMAGDVLTRLGLFPELHDNGGKIKPGLNLIANKTGKPEHSLNPAQTAAWLKNTEIVARMTDGPTKHVQIHNEINGVEASPDQLVRKLDDKLSWSLVDV